MIKKGFYRLAAALLYFISLLPFWLLYIIADGIYVLLYYVAGYRKKVVRNNLLNSFPDKTGAELKLIERKFYYHLADLIVETIKMLTVSEDEVRRCVTITNIELLEHIFANGRSILGVLGHYGNWELNALRFSQLVPQKRIIVYKPLSNNYFDTLFIRMRSRFGATLITMKGIARKLIAYKDERTITVLLGDQTPSRDEIQYFTSFLNQPTAVFSGVEKLAKFTNSEVVFCDVRRIKRGYYKCTFVPMFAEAKLTAEHEITDAHVQYLEQVIKEEPAYWLWSHRRWKHKPEDMA